MKKDLKNYHLQMGAIDELRDRLNFLAEEAENLVMGLVDRERYKENIGELFRYFHSIKALASFLELTEIQKSVAVIEDILSILRQKKPPIRQEIIDWLLQVCDQVVIWNDKIEAGRMDFEPIDAYTLNMVKSTVIINKKPEEILKNLNVLLLFEPEEEINKLQKSLKNSVKSLLIASDTNEAIKILTNSHVDILVLAEKIGDVSSNSLIPLLKVTNSNALVVVASETKISKATQQEFMKLGIELFINDVFKFDTLLQKLLFIAKQFFEEKSIKLYVSPIFRKISYLRPLPNTITEVQKLKANPNAGIKELTAIASKDPIISAKIIKFANSPLFGFRSEVSSLHHAISLLGKEKVIALILQAGIEGSLKVELEPYGIIQDEFFHISYLRMNIMMNWFPKVNLSKTAMMVTAALLGNIGQILIADEIKKRGESEKFLALLKQTDNQSFVEMEFCNTTSADVTADMLMHWGLEEELVQVIRYSCDIASAPDEIKLFSIALYALFEVVNGYSLEISKDKIEDMSALLAEMNFDPELFVAAIEKTLSKKR